MRKHFCVPQFLKSKKTFVILSLLLILVGVFAVIRHYWALASVTPNVEFTRMAFVNVVAQLLLSLLTFVAVLISLWMAGLKKIFIAPELELRLTNDELHCVGLGLSGDSRNELQDRRLAVYVHVENHSSIAAEDCRITCNEIYVSVDGKSFYKYRTLQTASFRWVYANKDEPYLATIRKRVEKYARVVEIVEQTNADNISMLNKSSDRDGDHLSATVDNDSKVSGPTSWLRVCLPLTPETDASIRIPTRYRAVMLPLNVVSRTSKESMFYATVAWNGDDVSKYRQAGFLDVAIVKDFEAREMIKSSYKES